MTIKNPVENFGAANLDKPSSILELGITVLHDQCSRCSFLSSLVTSTDSFIPVSFVRHGEIYKKVSEAQFKTVNSFGDTSPQASSIFNYQSAR